MRGSTAAVIAVVVALAIGVLCAPPVNAYTARSAHSGSASASGPAPHPPTPGKEDTAARRAAGAAGKRRVKKPANNNKPPAHKPPAKAQQKPTPKQKPAARKPEGKPAGSKPAGGNRTRVKTTAKPKGSGSIGPGGGAGGVHDSNEGQHMPGLGSSHGGSVGGSGSGSGQSSQQQHQQPGGGAGGPPGGQPPGGGGGPPGGGPPGGGPPGGGPPGGAPAGQQAPAAKQKNIFGVGGDAGRHMFHLPGDQKMKTAEALQRLHRHAHGDHTAFNGLMRGAGTSSKEKEEVATPIKPATTKSYPKRRNTEHGVAHNPTTGDALILKGGKNSVNWKHLPEGYVPLAHQHPFPGPDPHKPNYTKQHPITKKMHLPPTQSDYMVPHDYKQQTAHTTITQFRLNEDGTVSDPANHPIQDLQDPRPHLTYQMNNIHTLVPGTPDHQNAQGLMPEHTPTHMTTITAEGRNIVGQLAPGPPIATETAYGSTQTPGSAPVWNPPVPDHQ